MKPIKANSVDKTLMILACFLPYNKEMGTVEISQRLGFHKATVSRILQTLTKHRFLSQNTETKKFVLGSSVAHLARAIHQSLKADLVPIAKPFIDALRETLKETIILEVLSGKSTFIAYIAEGPQLVRLAGSLGDRLPVHAAAGAKAILAFSPPETSRALIGPDLPRFTKNTITEPAAFRRELDKIRREGVSFDQEEIDEGTCALGAPVFNHEGEPIAGVVVAAPSQRIAQQGASRIASILKETAARLSACFHYTEGPQRQNLRGGQESDQAVTAAKSPDRKARRKTGLR